MTWPWTSVSSLIASGMPSSGRVSPLRRRASAWAASARAISSEHHPEGVERRVVAVDPVEEQLGELAGADLAAVEHARRAAASPANATSVMAVVEAIGMLHGVPTGADDRTPDRDPGPRRRDGRRAPGRAVARARPARARARARGRTRYWLRPGWAWPVALAALLGAGGSLASVAWPLAGLIAAGLAAACLALEGAGLTSPLRLLTRRRATQNVVSLPGGRTTA